MTRRTIFTFAAALLLTACDSSTTAGQSVTTTMDAVEVEPGTISDAMIMLDDSGLDGTAVDTSAPAAAKADTASTQAAPEPATPAEPAADDAPPAPSE